MYYSMFKFYLLLKLYMLLKMMKGTVIKICVKVASSWPRGWSAAPGAK